MTIPSERTVIRDNISNVMTNATPRSVSPPARGWRWRRLGKPDMFRAIRYASIGSPQLLFIVMLRGLITTVAPTTWYGPESNVFRNVYVGSGLGFVLPIRVTRTERTSAKLLP